MRVTRIPGDFNDIGDRPSRVWCNEQEITDWTVADDFRRVVETPGKVHHGAVRIDLAPAEYSASGAVSREDGKPIAVTATVCGEPTTFVNTATKPICDATAPVENVTRIWSDKSQICAAPVKPKHIPARKRKAGK